RLRAPLRPRSRGAAHRLTHQAASRALAPPRSPLGGVPGRSPQVETGRAGGNRALTDWRTPTMPVDDNLVTTTALALCRRPSMRPNERPVADYLSTLLDSLGFEV